MGRIGDYGKRRFVEAHEAAVDLGADKAFLTKGSCPGRDIGFRFTGETDAEARAGRQFFDGADNVGRRGGVNDVAALQADNRTKAAEKQAEVIDNLRQRANRLPQAAVGE